MKVLFNCQFHLMFLETEQQLMNAASSTPKLRPKKGGTKRPREVGDGAKEQKSKKKQKKQ